MAGKGEPQEKNNSEGQRLKDYTKLGKWNGSIKDFYNKLDKNWPAYYKMFSSENISYDNLDEALNTGSHTPTEQKIMKGQYLVQIIMIIKNYINEYGKKIIHFKKITKIIFKIYLNMILV